MPDTIRRVCRLKWPKHVYSFLMTNANFQAKVLFLQKLQYVKGRGMSRRTQRHAAVSNGITVAQAYFNVALTSGNIY